MMNTNQTFVHSLIEDLQATAGHFRRGANQVRKRM
jgi:hypothetical protein